jgi:hypothetical protein
MPMNGSTDAAVFITSIKLKIAKEIRKIQRSRKVRNDEDYKSDYMQQLCDGFSEITEILSESDIDDHNDMFARE